MLNFMNMDTVGLRLSVAPGLSVTVAEVVFSKLAAQLPMILSVPSGFVVSSVMASLIAAVVQLPA